MFIRVACQLSLDYQRFVDGILLYLCNAVGEAVEGEDSLFNTEGVPPLLISVMPAETAGGGNSHS